MAGESSLDDRLDSWKEIAAYLRRDVTTAQRWEKREGMPVHRHLHDKLGSVYAFRRELDEWSRSRKANQGSPLGENLVRSVLAPPSPPPPAVRGRPSAAGALSIAGSALAVAILVMFWPGRADTWASLVAGAKIQRLDFDGTERAAAISPEGKFVAFLSDRDGQTDLWVTQVGTGRFYNLTRGAFPQLVNRAVRSVSFSPDGSLVTFWSKKQDGLQDGAIGIWAVPTLGGQPAPYLEGGAEVAWAGDASRLVYHTAGPGDPMFIREPGQRVPDRRIFTAPPGVHAHFLLWPPGQPFIYFVQGSVADYFVQDAAADVMDIWRLREGGGTPERLTNHNARVSYPVMVDARTLLYLASDADGGGPWLHALDLERRASQRLGSHWQRYTSLAASADARRLAVTLTSPRESFWRLPVPDPALAPRTPERISLTTARSLFPRLGPGFLVYVAFGGGGDTVWKVAGGAASELWSAAGARVLGPPTVAPDGLRVAFSVERQGRRSLIVINADGTGARSVADSLELRGAPAWAPDGQSITTSAHEGGVPRLFSIPLDGRQPLRLTRDYAVDPIWSSDGQFIVYSGPDIGTTFSLAAVGADGSPHPLPPVTLSRGARRLRFLPRSKTLVLMRGGIEHKDLWAVDLQTGVERPLTNLPRDFYVQDFDVSPDGREMVLHRLQEQSDLVLLDLPRR